MKILFFFVGFWIKFSSKKLFFGLTLNFFFFFLIQYLGIFKGLTRNRQPSAKKTTYPPEG